jgi:5-methylcytosine-specific restriction endonuclease McrA
MRKKVGAEWEDTHHRFSDRVEYKQWRSAVLVRDQHKCRGCGKEGDEHARKGSHRQLHVHHIRDFRKHPELRYDVGNGITLCAACHPRLHWDKISLL